MDTSWIAFKAGANDALRDPRTDDTPSIRVSFSPLRPPLIITPLIFPNA